MSQDCEYVSFNIFVGSNPATSTSTVGFYSLIEKKVTLVKSMSGLNGDAILSPNDNFVAFSCYYFGPCTAIYDRIKDTTIYDVVPFKESRISDAFAWRTDSTLLFATFEGIVEKNIYTNDFKLFSIPDTESMSVTIPGTQACFITDSLYFLMCGDWDSSFGNQIGAPTNVFLVRNQKATRLLSGSFNAKFIRHLNQDLYIDYLDLSESEEGIEKLVRYNLKSGMQSPVKRLGMLIGMGSKK